MRLGKPYEDHEPRRECQRRHDFDRPRDTEPVAARGIKIESLRFDAEGELDLHAFLGLSDTPRPGFERITFTATVKADAPRAQLEELCEYVQRTSPVLDIIRNPVPVSIRLVTE